MIDGAAAIVEHSSTAVISAAVFCPLRAREIATALARWEPRAHGG